MLITYLLYIVCFQVVFMVIENTSLGLNPDLAIHLALWAQASYLPNFSGLFPHL